MSVATYHMADFTSTKKQLGSRNDKRLHGEVHPKDTPYHSRLCSRSLKSQRIPVVLVKMNDVTRCFPGSPSSQAGQRPAEFFAANECGCGSE